MQQSFLLPILHSYLKCVRSSIATQGSSFGQPGKSILDTFVEGRNALKYKKKQLIYAEGNHPFYLFYIQSGIVNISVTNEYGKELIVSLCREGDFFGYTAMFEGVHCFA